MLAHAVLYAAERWDITLHVSILRWRKEGGPKAESQLGQLQPCRSCLLGCCTSAHCLHVEASCRCHAQEKRSLETAHADDKKQLAAEREHAVRLVHLLSKDHERKRH